MKGRRVTKNVCKLHTKRVRLNKVAQKEKKYLFVSIQSIKIGQTEVSPVASVRNLGIWFDTHLDMGTHITKRLVAALSITYTIYIILGNIDLENQLRN